MIKTLKFRISFGIWWWAFWQTQVIIIHQVGFSWTTAFIDSTITNLLLGGTLLLISTSLQHYLPQKNKYGYILSLCLVLTLLWMLISRTLCLFFIDETGYALFWKHTLLVRSAVGFLVTGCMALITTLWYTLQDQREIEKRKEEADQMSKSAELYHLRQQLQPHFLFNSLNSINALIPIQPEKARTMTQQLSDFLRGTLKEQAQWVSLEQELEQIRLYLEIEKVRFGHRLSAEVINESTDAMLPAMLLQPVVENAIKFGLYDTTDDITISIIAKKENNYLRIQVSNPFDPQTSAPKGTGFGLNSVRRRLYLLFSRNDLLNTHTENDHFFTTISIPQHESHHN